MYYALAAGAQLYRVTGPGVNWPTPLLGLGAYFTKGGRYNAANDATVYCAEDPLAVLAEAAFYEALEWHDYLGTQALADDVRGHVPPAGSPDPRPEGVKAPAIRVKPVAGYSAHQLALFVFDPAANINQPYPGRSNLLLEWDLEFQFLQRNPRQAVTALTVDIDWCIPQFRIGGAGAAVIPAYSPRPNAKTYNPKRWYNLAIHFA